MTRKQAIARSFEAAADTYEQGAGVQREIARRLADRIGSLRLPTRPRILEIGCGTGLLSRLLRDRLPDADWIFTDVSHGMVANWRKSVPEAGFVVMDGERPCFSSRPGFDLICSSMVFQWFEDPASAIRGLGRLLAPGGHLAFATLARDSFAEWRTAHAEVGLIAGTPVFPDAMSVARMLPEDGVGSLREEKLLWRYPHGRAFVRDLKRIGAAVPAAGRAPLPPGALRRVLRRFEPPQGIGITYHLAYGFFTRDEQLAPRGVFVTGTDTGVGKTLVSAGLVRAWNGAYWKPVQTGYPQDDDTGTVEHLAGVKATPPARCFSAPLSPHAAAALEGAEIALEDFTLPATDGPLVVEGAGGVMVPLNDHALMIDLIERLGLPVVIVARSTLGTINHTLLTLAALRARGIGVAGVILNGPPNPGNRAAIEQFGAVRVLAELPAVETVDTAAIARFTALIPAFEALAP